MEAIDRAANQLMAAEHGVLLSNLAPGSCVQTVFVQPGETGNDVLAGIARNGGQIMSMHPLFSEMEKRWRVLVIFVLPLSAVDDLRREMRS